MRDFLSTMFILCFRIIPTGLRRAVFIIIALSYYRLFPRRRLIALNNLQVCFPEKDIGDRVAIAKGVYRNMAIVAAELFDIPFLTPDNVYNIVEVEGLDYCRQALKEGKGILLFTAHFGNWQYSRCRNIVLTRTDSRLLPTSR